ncbi:hypothetical protein SNEBB_010797, partial [Seison nebaliae]
MASVSIRTTNKLGRLSSVEKQVYFFQPKFLSAANPDVDYIYKWEEATLKQEIIAGKEESFFSTHEFALLGIILASIAGFFFFVFLCSFYVIRHLKIRGRHVCGFIDVDSEISNLDQKADKNLIEDDDWLREMPSLDRIDAIAIRDINGRK